MFSLVNCSFVLCFITFMYFIGCSLNLVKFCVLFTVIVVGLWKGNESNVPVKFLFEGSNNMVSGDDSARKATELSLTEESYINNSDLDMISLFLLNVLLLAG